MTAITHDEIGAPQKPPWKELASGEALTTRVQLYPTTWWANSYNPTVIQMAELPDGWIIDRIECTDPVVVVYPDTQHSFRLTYDADQVGDGEISASCTIWTEAVG